MASLDGGAIPITLRVPVSGTVKTEYDEES